MRWSPWLCEIGGVEDDLSSEWADGMLVGAVGIFVLLVEMFEYDWERPVRCCGIWGVSMRRFFPSHGFLCSKLISDCFGIVLL